MHSLHVNEIESYCHIISQCEELHDARELIMKKIREFCLLHNFSHIDQIFSDDEMKTQFILDPCSMNFQDRVQNNDVMLQDPLKMCRNLCNNIHTLKVKKMKLLRDGPTC